MLIVSERHGCIARSLLAKLARHHTSQFTHICQYDSPQGRAGARALSMQRIYWFEVHDHPHFPRFLHHLGTDALEAMWNATDMSTPIMRRLRPAMENAATQEVLTL